MLSKTVNQWWYS